MLWAVSVVTAGFSKVPGAEPWPGEGRGVLSQQEGEDRRPNPDPSLNKRHHQDAPTHEDTPAPRSHLPSPG